MSLVLVGAADPLDGRAPAPGSRRHEAQPMEVAAEPDRRAVAQPAAGGELGAIARLPGEVAPEPRLALGEERVDVALRDPPSRADRRPAR